MRWFQRFLLLFAFALLLTACQPVIEDVRPHGQTLTYAVTDTIASVFFQLQIEEVKVTRNLNDFIPEDRQALLLTIDMKIENLTSNPLPMSYADFRLIYKDETGKEQFLYPLEPFIEAQFPDTYTLKENEIKSGMLVFQIPKDLEQCQLLYEEIYDDNFVGNKHLISFVLLD